MPTLVPAEVTSSTPPGMIRDRGPRAMIDFDPFSEEYFDDPLPIYRRLRDEAPAYHHEGLDCFFLSRFEDVWQAVGSGHFSHRFGTNTQDLLAGVPPQRALSSMLPPAHTAVRGCMLPYFSPSAARNLEGSVREWVAKLLDEALERGEI